jgi:hypothetical protein
MEIVGTKNDEYSSHSFQHQKDVEVSDFYLEFINYKEMNQLELSKKIPKWRKIFNDEGIRYSSYKRKQHLKKYCSQCDVSKIFNYSTILDHTNHKRPWRTCNDLFWNEYRTIARHRLSEVDEYYRSKKIENETELKLKMSEHQKTEVVCECGGHYSLRNKIKHCITQKHIKFCQESKK